MSACWRAFACVVVVVVVVVLLLLLKRTYMLFSWAKDVNLHRGAWACLYGPGGKPSTVKLITDHFEDYWRFDKIVRLGYQRDFFKNRWPLSGPPLNHKLVFSVDKKQKPKKRKRMSDGGTGIATVRPSTAVLTISTFSFYFDPLFPHNRYKTPQNAESQRFTQRTNINTVWVPMTRMRL